MQAAGPVIYEVRDEVAVIGLQAPPVNGLGHALRTAIVAALDRAQGDAVVRAIVLKGAAGVFSGGADIREFGTPAATAAPNLRQVIDRVEGASKPVVASIVGVCMGGGLELVLGCHARVASAQASLALPEVKLGLLPGAGGTQRLARIVGAQAALHMIVSGEPVAAHEAPRGLIDALVEGDPAELAAGVAREIARGRRPWRRTRDLEVAPAGADVFARARAEIRVPEQHLPAPYACIDAVEASMHSTFDAGMAFERERFVALMASPASRALRHAFLAERASAKVDDLPAEIHARPIRECAIVGAGTMGSGIAMACLDVGWICTLIDADRAAIDHALRTMRAFYDNAVRKGGLAHGDADARLARVRTSLAIESIATADLVVEAVFEDLDVKTRVFRAIDAHAKPGAILATNTSTLDVERIARATARAQDVVGLHFFTPANVMRLLEIVRADSTSHETLATALAIAKKLRKVAVVARVCDGFIGNRMVEQLLRQAFFMLDEGALPAQIDAALTAWGMAMGPFAMLDLAGNDVSQAIRKRRARERPEQRYSTVADRICDLGRFGQKTGAGWYRYAPGSRSPMIDPMVDALVRHHQREVGFAPRAIDDAEIVDRCILALVNEGARLLDEGIAARASDIDVVYLHGYGFPRFRGGPMFYAQSIGLDQAAERMREFATNTHADPAFWQPAASIERTCSHKSSMKIHGVQ